MLTLIFGVTSSVCETWLKFGIHILDVVLGKMAEARIAVPDATTMPQFVAAIRERHNLLDNFWAVVDGLKLYLSECGDSFIQNAYYNGWTADCYIGNLFVFTPDGCIAFRILNAPGIDFKIVEISNIHVS